MTLVSGMRDMETTVEAQAAAAPEPAERLYSVELWAQRMAEPLRKPLRDLADLVLPPVAGLALLLLIWQIACSQPGALFRHPGARWSAMRGR